MKSILTAFVISATAGRPICGAVAGSRRRVANAFVSSAQRQHQPNTAQFPRFTAALAVSTPSLASTSTNAQDPTVAIVDEIPLALPPLKNYYYLLRHGQSTANVAGIISSARSLAGSTKHGLTLLGMQQGRDSAASLVDMVAEDINNNNDDDTPKSTKQIYFYSSPFARAKETAEECIKGISGNPEVARKVEVLGLTVNESIFLDDGLMERFFGRLDGKELATYAYVWPVDIFEPTHTAFDVESVAAVSTRIRSTLLDIDSQHGDGGNHIVLTSHADVLQITQVYAAGIENVGKFSQYRFGNGEVRRMGRKVDSLPEAAPLQPPRRGD
eukprot:CAMPEP_0172551358 /NCGR_PEP_ID=MMETSP1067-20121228/38589_1 /TAXON_ID=265564 ORGANISM="Thalassiosira punctigera, Strain Tpunct2005C2" /NCGR_SAMPLE_ID=MMETSP1067 /ASSEMBLY_ACC=CAM_ASM_000444 /LENGTH=327 /DNA_ID=CAMNT_0013339141 /DNA_START=1 /DNA_END=984 /DNA_ORIENTATION=+